MGNRLHSPQNSPIDERVRLAIAALVLAMIPVVVIGVLVAVSLGASYWVAGPLASLVGIPALKVLSHYFD